MDAVSDNETDFIYCNNCNKEFEDSFQLVDHLTDEDEVFDPYLILGNGHRLMLGSLLRFLFSKADQPEQVKLITQQTYITLFAFENGYEETEELIQDMVIKSNMQDFDDSLKSLLDGELGNEE